MPASHAPYSLATQPFTGRSCTWFGGWTPRHGIALGIAFVVDPAGAALTAFSSFLTMAALLYAWTYYDRDDGAFSALLLVFSAALSGFFLSGDLFQYVSSSSN